MTAQGHPLFPTSSLVHRNPQESLRNCNILLISPDLTELGRSDCAVRLKIMNHEIGYVLGVIFVLCLSQFFAMSGLRQSIRRLERKLDVIIKQQGIESPDGISAEVRLMAQDGEKIAAIQLHRDQNPELSLAKAKKDIEDCASIK
jgi:hypothetical protein